MKTNPRKKGTQTSSFGSPGRINHDSTLFYTSKLYEGLPREQKVKYVENLIPLQFLDKIFCKSSENMEELPDNSVHLMVTSPPYNVGKEYGTKPPVPVLPQHGEVGFLPLIQH